VSSVRKPKDDAETERARIAIEQGKGTSLADFIEGILEVTPEGEFVEAVRNRIEFAHLQEETLDIITLIKEMAEIQDQWA
jgi:hypothetical protein